MEDFELRGNLTQRYFSTVVSMGLANVNFALHDRVSGYAWGALAVFFLVTVAVGEYSNYVIRKILKEEANKLPGPTAGEI